MLKKLLIAAGALCAGLLLAAYAVFWLPNTFEGDRFITVSKGESFRQVLDSLERAGIIRSRTLTDIAGRISAYTTRMQIGRYRFRSGMSNIDVLHDIRYGETAELIRVLIPEGLRPSGQAHILALHLGIDSARFVALVHDSALARTLGAHAPSLIGYCMPMTYAFYWQADEEEIVREMVARFWMMYDSSLRAATYAGGRSINEVLTLASIVEKETRVDSERAIIAGVYANRLRVGMRLQADPTVQFAMLEENPRPAGRIDLDWDSPYNTYRHEGLPPGPIDSPGKQAILAALNPARHKYFYFVATGFGGHRFTRTFSEHLRAVRSYHRVKEEQKAARESVKDAG